MVLWNLYLYWKNYDTLELQWSDGKHSGTILKLWYFDLTRKTHGRLAKTNKTLIYNGGKCNMPKQMKFLSEFIALEQWFTIVLWKTCDIKREKNIVL